jgi:iron complex outermembrane receptor protein
LVICGETVVVTGNPDEPVRGSSVATKIETPLVETPRSISTIDRRTLDDMGVINVTQAHDYAVGLTPLDERGPGFARGFPVEFYDLRRDGLRTYTWSVREPVALDRIQYLRGPDGVLYGDGSPGALVNMVLKKPLSTPRYEVGVSAGSQGLRRFTADLTGPLSDNRRVRYRVVAASEWLQNGFDNNERRVTLLPTIALDLGTRGTLIFDTEFYTQRGRSSRHAVPATADAQAGDFTGYPWTLNVNSPESPFGWTGSNLSPGVRLDLELGSRSSLHIAGRYTKIDGDINVQSLGALDADQRNVARFQYRERSTWHELQTDSFAATTTRTGRIEHRLVVGVEAGLSTADSLIGIGAAAPLDVLNPVYPATPEPTSLPTRYGVTRLGVYGLDQVRLSNRVIVVPGFRLSAVEVENRVATTGEPRSSQRVVSPSLGLIVLPRPWLSMYTTYAQGFAPPAPGQYLEGGRGLAPSESEMLEAGVKADLSGQRLSVTAAGFSIRRTNVAEADARGFYRQIGEAASHGLEVEAVGSIARGLAIRGGYSWTSTEITRDTSGFVGRELPNAPRHKTQIWTRYRVTQGRLSGLMLAGGVVSVASQYTARNNLIALPHYTRVDASTSYEFAGPRLTLAVIVHNLTNRHYATTGAGATFIAAPLRRIALQLTTLF